jgi:threonine/homoserine/homoserine lactone efflux protein
MPQLTVLAGFSLVALGMVVTPGPNMIYLISRSPCQGRSAGLISLIGVGVCFLFYVACASLGITALVFAVPVAYEALKIAGALYLLYLAWNAVKPGGRSPFELRQLKPDSPRKLFLMGLTTNLPNPKAAVLYLSLLPQFIDPARGSVLGQSLILGCTQIAVSMVVNSLIVVTAGAIAAFLATRPTWARIQRWVMGGMLAGLAVRMAAASR